MSKSKLPILPIDRVIYNRDESEHYNEMFDIVSWLDINRIIPYSKAEEVIHERDLTNMETHFDSRANEPIIVGKLNVPITNTIEYYCCEGHKRLLMAKRANQKRIHAYITKISSVDEVGEIYLLFANNKKKKDNKDTHAVKCDVGDWFNIRIQQILNKYGIHYSFEKESNSIRASCTIEGIVGDRFNDPIDKLEKGFKVLDMVLYTITESFHGDANSYKAILLQGIADFLHDVAYENKHFGIEGFIDELVKVGLNMILNYIAIPDHLKNLGNKEIKEKAGKKRSIQVFKTLHNRNSINKSQKLIL